MMNANNKYKTVICKHFEQSGHCYLEDKCHFAHGKQELRNLSDPLPPNQDLNTSDNKSSQNYPAYSMPPTVSNYKTIKCRFFEKGMCKFGGGCSFAHGDQDVRSINSPVPQHVASALPMNNVMMPPQMPSMFDQNTQNQIAQQQIMFLTKQMEQYHRNDQEHIAKLNQATEMNNAGNVQAAASLVYGIINRQNRSKDDETNYNSFTQQTQSYGNYLYQNLQMAYAQAVGMYGYNPQGMMGNPMMAMTSLDDQGHSNKQFGGHNYKQGKVQSQSNQDQSTDGNRSPGKGNDVNMQGLSNKMGNMQISNQGNANVKGNGDPADTRK